MIKKVIALILMAGLAGSMLIVSIFSFVIYQGNKDNYAYYQEMDNYDTLQAKVNGYLINEEEELIIIDVTLINDPEEIIYSFIAEGRNYQVLMNGNLQLNNDDSIQLDTIAVTTLFSSYYPLISLKTMNHDYLYFNAGFINFVDDQYDLLVDQYIRMLIFHTLFIVFAIGTLIAFVILLRGDGKKKKNKEEGFSNV